MDYILLFAILWWVLFHSVISVLNFILDVKWYRPKIKFTSIKIFLKHLRLSYFKN